MREDLSRHFTVLKPRVSGNRVENRKCVSVVVRRCSGTRTPRKINTGAKRNEQDSPIRVNRVTNDGATILRATQLDDAAAKILVNISKVGDGTTIVTDLAAELLREAEKPIAKKSHPQAIVEGYRIASLAEGSG